MRLEHPAAPNRAGRLALLGPVLLLALGIFAYRPLLSPALHTPVLDGVEQWFFTPEQKTPLLAVGIAGWLLWRRRARLLSLPRRTARAATAALLAIGTGLFVWSQLTRAVEPLLVSLTAHLLAYASAIRGRAGCRAVWLPAAVLLLGLPIPAPIRNELVWQLQLFGASATTWLLQAVGFDVAQSGIVIRRGGYTFTVIESCSGLRGIEILLLVAVATRELFTSAGRRAWLLLAFAPALAIALNLVRIGAVVLLASSAESAPSGPAEQDHTAQGLAVLVAGTAALYALGWWLARAGNRAPSDATQRDRSAHALPWRPAGAGLAALGVLSVALPAFPRPPPVPARIDVPLERADWSAGKLNLDFTFLGSMPKGTFLHRRYEREHGHRSTPVVDLFVGLEVAANPTLLSPKTTLPGPDWSLRETQHTRLWMLGIDAELAVASRDGELALVLSWRPRDEGVLRETRRVLLALDAGPLRRERPRAVVRLVTPLPRDGPTARDRARRTLDLFIRDFRDELAHL